MNKQRKVLITITYNEMGIIIDTKAEEVVQPDLQQTRYQLATDCISRQAAINNIKNGFHWETVNGITAQAVLKQVIHDIEIMPSVQPERKRGEWYKPKEYPRDSYRYICSNCQDVAYYVTGNNGKKQKEDKPKCGYRYCPNCGAEMQRAREKNADANT